MKHVIWFAVLTLLLAGCGDDEKKNNDVSDSDMNTDMVDVQPDVDMDIPPDSPDMPDIPDTPDTPDLVDVPPDVDMDMVELPMGTNLDVQITGLPAGVDAAVTVEGPNGFMQTLTVSEVLGSVEAGDYTITVDSVRSTGSIVDELFNGGADRATVTLAEMTTESINISYAKRPGSGHLWVVSTGAPGVSGYSNATLEAATDTTPDVVLTGDTSVFENSAGIAFDSEGNLWVGNCGSANDDIVMIDKDSLRTTGTVTATRTLELADVNCIVDLAFGPNGELAVADYASGVPLTIIPAAELAQSGTPTVIEVSNFNFVDMVSWDDNGGVWTVEYFDDRVRHFESSQLTVTNRMEMPTQQWFTPMDSGPSSVVFLPSQGGLLVTLYDTSEIHVIDQADLGSATYPAHVTLTMVDGPETPSFDNAGDLWVALYNTNSLARVPAAALATPGAPTYSATFSNIAQIYNTEFNPPPLNVPIY